VVVDLMWMTHFKKEDLPCVLLIATHSSFISGLEWKRQRKKEWTGYLDKLQAIHTGRVKITIGYNTIQCLFEVDQKCCTVYKKITAISYHT